MRLFRFRFLVSTIQIVGVTVLVAGILTWALLARQTAPSTSAAAGAGRYQRFRPRCSLRRRQ
jgi:hypothetical protein